MLTFISNHFTAIVMLLMTLASVTLGVLNWLFTRKAKATGEPIKPEVANALSGASEVLTKVYKMLPSLITFSETMNSNKSGAVKKEFVLDYIKNMYGSLGVEISDDALALVSSAIDDIVSATKRMHTGGESK